MEQGLSKSEENFCEMAGIAGGLLSGACLLQTMLYFLSHWITALVVFLYIFSLISFILLAKKKVVAPPLLLSSAVLVFILEAFMLFTLTFSVVLALLFIYLLVITLIIYTGDIKGKLKLKHAGEKAEAAKWDGII